MSSTRLSQRTGRHAPRRSAHRHLEPARRVPLPTACNRGAGALGSRAAPRVFAHGPAAPQINQVGTNRSAVIPELGAHCRLVEEYRGGPGVQQRHSDASIAAPDLETSLDACGAIRSQADSRERKPDLRAILCGRHKGVAHGWGCRDVLRERLLLPSAGAYEGNQQDERGAASLSRGPAGCHQVV